MLRGVAFRSSRAEPFGEAFLRQALEQLLTGNVFGVRGLYLDAVTALRARAVRTLDVTARVRLTKTPDQYLSTREQRRELAYEAVLASGRASWKVGERLRVYRATGKRAALLPDPEEEDESAGLDPRDYDIEHYVRVLSETFGARLQRALHPEDFAAIFADPGQLTLFPKRLAEARPILTILAREA